MNLNQILQEKFPHLEVSVLKLSEVQRDNATKRMDSEYFKKEYLEKIQALLSQSQKLSKLMVSGYYGILPKSDDYLENGLCLVRGKDLRDSSLEITNLVKVPFDYFDERYCIHKNDILFLVKGATIGNDDGVLFIVDEPQEKMIFNGSVFKLQVKNINPAYIYIFMMTSFFTFQKLREVANNGIEYNSLQTIKNYLIPLLPMSFQLEIEKMVKDSHQALEQSKVLYKEAETLLYVELGLDPANPMQSILQSNSNSINYTIRSLKESFLKTGRLDSEYYQAKYEKFEALIKNYKNGWDCVKTFFSQNNTSCNFSKSEYKYIEIGDINTSSGIASYNTIQTNELPANAKMAVAKDDILISKVRPYRGAVAIIDFKAQDIVASGAFAVLREKGNFKKEVLQVLLRTSIYKEWLLKWNVGTSYPVIKDEDILNLPIPKIDLQTQDSIAFHIQQSFTLRAEAKALLEEAKVKVESAISGGGGGKIIPLLYP